VGLLSGERQPDPCWRCVVGAQRAYDHAQPHLPTDPALCHSRSTVPYADGYPIGYPRDTDQHPHGNPNVYSDIDRDAHCDLNGHFYAYFYTHTYQHTWFVTKRASYRLYEMEPHPSSRNYSGPERVGLWAACIVDHSHAGEYPRGSGGWGSCDRKSKRPGYTHAFSTHCADANLAAAHGNAGANRSTHGRTGGF